MVAILENPEIRQLVQMISVGEYESFGERIDGKRTELIRGIIIQKMPASPLHSFLVGRLQRLAQAAASPHAHCRQEQPVKLGDSMPEPDLAVVIGQMEDYFDRHPSTASWVMEVAVSSKGLDREKASLYAEAGVGEYWILLAAEKAVEVYTFPQDGEYTLRRTYRVGETLESAVLPALRIDLEELFRR